MNNRQLEQHLVIFEEQQKKYKKGKRYLPGNFNIHFVVVQLLSCVLFATPWMAAHQASLSFTISWNLLKLMSIKLVMPGELLKDKNGDIVVTRLDEGVLQEVAQAGNGAYVRAGNSEFGLNPIIEDIRKMDDEKYKSIVFEEYDERFMYALGFAMLFLVLEMLVGDRRSRRHLFKR